MVTGTALDKGCLAMVVVTKLLAFEGKKRMHQAEKVLWSCVSMPLS